MNDILELLPIPEARDFPAERFDARRAALVAAIRADATNESLGRRMGRLAGKARLALLGALPLGIALLLPGFSAQHRPAPSDAVAVLAAVGTAQIVVAAAPRVRLAGSLPVARTL